MKTQDELETIARKYEQEARKKFLLIGNIRQFLGSLLLCLLNPLSMIGLPLPGLLTGIFFLILLAWKGMDGEFGSIRTLLLWWCLWAALLYGISFIIRCIIWQSGKKELYHYHPPLPTDKLPGQISCAGERNAPVLHWQRSNNAWLAKAFVHVPDRALYGWRLTVEDYQGTLSKEPDNACAVLADEAPGWRNCYQMLYRLEPGWHCLSFAMTTPDSPQSGEAPPEGSLKQL